MPIFAAGFILFHIIGFVALASERKDVYCPLRRRCECSRHPVLGDLRDSESDQMKAGYASLHLRDYRLKRFGATK